MSRVKRILSLPLLIYNNDGLSEDRAFAEWRAVMAPMFEVRPAYASTALPRGSVQSILIGDVIANRTAFTAQHLVRDAALVAATPGHLLLQAYISGGFHGTFAGQPITVGKGTVAVTDLRQTIDVRAATSNTVGITLPQSLAAEIGTDALTQGLDPVRNRLLAAWIITFYRRLPRKGAADIPSLTREIVTVLQRLCDASATGDALAGAESDPDHLALAERLIRAELGRPNISPDWLADQLRVSRATLYRLFAPLGGVMRHVQEQRLQAAYAALSDALEMRSLAKIASDLGFGSAALFSRSFGERFGLSPSSFRTAVVAASQAARPPSVEPVQSWWRRLGG